MFSFKDLISKITIDMNQEDSLVPQWIMHWCKGSIESGHTKLIIKDKKDR